MNRWIALLPLLVSCASRSNLREDWVVIGIHGCAYPLQNCVLERLLVDAGIECQSEGSVVYSIEVRERDVQRALALLLRARQAGGDFFQPIEEARFRSGCIRNADSAAMRARSFVSAGDWNSALAMLDVAIRIRPECADYLSDRARVRLKLGDREGAVIDLETALRIATRGEVDRSSVEELLRSLQEK